MPIFAAQFLDEVGSAGKLASGAGSIKDQARLPAAAKAIIATLFPTGYECVRFHRLGLLRV
jgi:hypothetical protein